ncbi:MAG: SpoIVB peptidase [Firmicutes bacterium]|nr:SpoIVB peptidase [Bacillota bacterium]
MIVFAFAIGMYSAWHNFLPCHQLVKVGDQITAGRKLPESLNKNLTLHLRSVNNFFAAGGSNYRELTFTPGQITPVALKPGRLEMSMKLFGFLPLHRMTVSVVAPPMVIPGGHSIGILTQSEGVLVVGEAPVLKDGGQYFPARLAHISIGDIIMEANGMKIESEGQLQEIIDQCGSKGKEVALLVKHGDKTLKKKIKPVLCDKTGRFRIGLFIKGAAAGVGTMTFYVPQSGIYGALGHIIADSASGRIINLQNGKIVDASIKNLHPGRKGQPGEKLGVFTGNNDVIGNIEKNTPFGIFGHLDKNLVNSIYRRPIPIAMKYQIQTGPAEILTVLHDNKLEEFGIDIEKVITGDNQGKDMIIRITDPDLLNRSGGIIQGMSGSPIIQKGKLAGAVTHVFVNDPTQGYAVAAENMLMEVNLIYHKGNENIAS